MLRSKIDLLLSLIIATHQCLQMSDDVQIVSVTRPKGSRRKRRRSAVYSDVIDVVAIENLPEVTLVELPEQESCIHIDSDDDFVTVTGVSQRKKVR